MNRLFSQPPKTTYQLHVQDLVNDEEFLVEVDGSMNDLIVRMMWGEYRSWIKGGQDTAPELDKDLGIVFYVYPDHVLLRLYTDFGNPGECREDIAKIFAGGKEAGL